MEAFDDIENLTIERFYNNYINSNGDQKYRIVELGTWSVDIKLRLMVLTHEPGKFELYRIVIRG